MIGVFLCLKTWGITHRFVTSVYLMFSSVLPSLGTIITVNGKNEKLSDNPHRTIARSNDTLLRN